MTTPDGRSVAYWKARAEALEAVNRRLRERLLALAATLPPEYLDELELGSGGGGERRPPPAVVNPGGAGPHLTPADVEPEIRSLWARTAPPARD